MLPRIAERLGRRRWRSTDRSASRRTPDGSARRKLREELEDALVYLACAWLKTETHREVTR